MAPRSGALLFVLASAAAATTFTIDASSPIATPLNFPLLDCVGSGHGTLALRADYQAHLAQVQKDIGFKHIRGHGLLDDDMSTLLGGTTSLYNLFRVFDFYLSVGIRPIFELSFMPAALALDKTKTIMHYDGITSAPKDFGAWAAFITEVVQGCVDRYGIAEVRSWKFEVCVAHNAPAAERTTPAARSQNIPARGARPEPAVGTSRRGAASTAPRRARRTSSRTLSSTISRRAP
jgi:hypothetical protein